MHIQFFLTKVSPPVTSRLTILVLFLITLSTLFMCFSVMYFRSYARRTRQLEVGRYQNLQFASTSIENFYFLVRPLIGYLIQLSHTTADNSIPYTSH